MKRKTRRFSTIIIPSFSYLISAVNIIIRNYISLQVVLKAKRLQSLNRAERSSFNAAGIQIFFNEHIWRVYSNLKYAMNISELQHQCFLWYYEIIL